jgi:hypothetical protein
LDKKRYRTERQVSTAANDYEAPNEETGRAALEQFGEKRHAKYPLIYKSWESNWPDLCEFFKYPQEIRPVISTTNAIESLNYPLRKVTRNRSMLASDGARCPIPIEAKAFNFPPHPLSVRIMGGNLPPSISTGSPVSTSSRIAITALVSSPASFP